MLIILLNEILKTNFFFLIGLSVAIVIFVVKLIKYINEKNRIKNIPKSKIRSVAIGLSEIKGKAKAIQLHKTPISKQDCVYYRYIVEQYHEDSNDNSDGYRIIVDEQTTDPFLVQDETGEIKVYAQGSENYLSLKKTYFSRLGLKLIPMSFSHSDTLEQEYIKHRKEIEVKGDNAFSKSIVDLEGDRLYKEYFLAPGDNVYVLGTVAYNEDQSDAFIHQDHVNKYFIISDKSENSLLKTINKKLFITTLIGSFLIIGFIVSLCVPI